MVEGYESDECFRADQWVDSRVYDVKDEPDFDGSNTDKGNWILTQREKMAGWKTEYDKTLDNSAAAGVNDGLPRPVRLRCYNMKDVIVEQVPNNKFQSSGEKCFIPSVFAVLQRGQNFGWKQDNCLCSDQNLEKMHKH